MKSLLDPVVRMYIYGLMLGVLPTVALVTVTYFFNLVWLGLVLGLLPTLGLFIWFVKTRSKLTKEEKKMNLQNIGFAFTGWALFALVTVVAILSKKG